MAYSGKQPIGTMLIQAGKLDDDQLQKALRQQKENDGYIGCLLYTSDAADEEEV